MTAPFCSNDSCRFHEELVSEEIQALTLRNDKNRIWRIKSHTKGNYDGFWLCENCYREEQDR